jgi:hypothetical protein
MGNRYFYYMVFINATLNVIMYIPTALIRHRFDGALTGCLLSIGISILLMYQLIKRMNDFPGQGVPELIQYYLPKGIGVPLALLFVGFWFAAGLCTILAFTEITKEFIDPEISKMAAMGSFLLLALSVTRMKSNSILFGAEMLLVANMPLIVFILYKSLTGDQVRWDAVLEIITHSNRIPPYEVFASATFLLSGYTNIVVFNRTYTKPVNLKWLFIIMIPIGYGVMLSTFLTPFLYNGTMSIARFVFPWIMTADSIRMDFFLIERLTFIFLLIYVSISLVSIVIHWHVGYEFAKSVLPFRPGGKLYRYGEMMILFVFACISLAATNMNSMQIEDLNVLYQYFRFPAEFILLGLVMYLHRRKKML